MTTTSTIRYDTVAQLKAAPVDDGTVVLLVGKATIGDGLGGFYRWVAGDTTTEDMVYLNAISSTVAGVSGRWLRVFQRVRVMPHGVLVLNGGVRSFYFLGVTDANGEVTVNLTMDNTTTGAAIFAAEVWMIDSEAVVPATLGGINTTSNDVVVGSRKSLSADRKLLVYRFSRGNSTTLGGTLLSILGLVLPGLRAAGAGTPVAIRVDGV